jgi:peroxiredoxin
MYSRVVASAAAVSLCLGLIYVRPMDAQAAIPPKPPSPFELATTAFSDGDVTSMLESLDTRISGAKAKADLRFTLWDFGRVLQTGRMTTTQEVRVMAHLDGIAGERPSDAGVVAHTRHMVSALTAGKSAPDIEGQDLDGADLRLSDYRGKVVVLMFSGDWCGVCRVQYPYERLMLELYKNWPFAILGIDSSESLARARQVKADERLTYRSWWDGGAAKNTEGPIATSWNVVGWPTVYVLDREGVIRFIDVREEDLLKAVRLLLTEKSSASAR